MSVNRMLAVIAMFAALTTVSTVHAQDYPSRPVKIILGYAAGGPTDAVARVVSDGLAKRWKQPVVVENRPGAQGLIGTSAAARGAPDGYTLLLGTAFGALELADKSAGEVPSLKDFEPIALISLAPVGMVVRKDLGVRNLREFVDYARKNPGKLNYGGVRGSPLHIAMEQLVREQGLQMRFVPFASTAQNVQAILSGNVQLGMMDALSAAIAAQSGQAEMIGAVASSRLDQFPDVPTFTEQGFPGFFAEAWTGVLAPKGTADAVRAKIATDLAAVLNEDDAKSRIKALGFAMRNGDASALRQVIETEVAATRRGISEFGISAQ